MVCTEEMILMQAASRKVCGETSLSRNFGEICRLGVAGRGHTAVGDFTSTAVVLAVLRKLLLFAFTIMP